MLNVFNKQTELNTGKNNKTDGNKNDLDLIRTKKKQTHIYRNLTLKTHGKEEI